MSSFALMTSAVLMLAACGGGVSEEELEAVERDLQSQRARVQDLEAEVAGLQQRLNRGAAIFQVLEAIFAGPEGGEEADEPSGEAIREFAYLVQASGDPVLQAKWVEIIDTVLAKVPPLPPEAVAEIIAAVEASGDGQIGENLQEFLAAWERGEGGAALLELDAQVRDSEDPALGAWLIETFWIAFLRAEPPNELIDEFLVRAETSGNTEVQQALFALGGPPSEFFEEIGAKLKAVGDPSLDALAERVSGSAGGQGFDALFEGLFAEMGKTLAGVDAVQR